MSHTLAKDNPLGVTALVIILIYLLVAKETRNLKVIGIITLFALALIAVSFSVYKERRLGHEQSDTESAATPGKNLLVNDGNFTGDTGWTRFCSSQLTKLEVTAEGTKLGNCRIVQIVKTDPNKEYRLRYEYRNGCLHALGANKNPIEDGKDQGAGWKTKSYVLYPLLGTAETEVVLEACNAKSEGTGIDAEIKDVSFSELKP